jgi:hypothetical protein
MFSDNKILEIKSEGRYYAEIYGFAISKEILSFGIKIFDVDGRPADYYKITKTINLVKRKIGKRTLLLVNKFIVKTSGQESIDMSLSVSFVKKEDFLEMFGIKNPETVSTICCSADISRELPMMSRSMELVPSITIRI